MSATAADLSTPPSSYNSVFWFVFNNKMGKMEIELQMFSGLQISLYKNTQFNSSVQEMKRNCTETVSNLVQKITSCPRDGVNEAWHSFVLKEITQSVDPYSC